MRYIKITCCGLGIAFLLTFIVFVDRGIHKPNNPNVILIVVDTLRADHLSCYGYGRNTTPFIDEFASESMLFRNAIANSSWTAPSIGSMFTSQYASAFGILEFKDLKKGLAKQLVTLAEVFQKNAYLTKGIISHDMISANMGFNQGFDSYDEENCKGELHISSPSVTEKAIDFVSSREKDPFFLFLHYFDPHDSFILHKEFNYYPDYRGWLSSPINGSEVSWKVQEFTQDDRQYLVSVYDSEVSFTDKHIGRFLHALKKDGLYDDSLIIITSDHGEMLTEKQRIGHGRTVYQPVLHVPLIIKYPGMRNKRVTDEYVGLIDLMPTLISYLGLHVPSGLHLRRDAIAWDGTQDLTGRAVFSETNSPQINVQYRSVIMGGWKLVHELISDAKMLFYLPKDPEEHQDLILANKGKSEELETLFYKWSDRVREQRLFIDQSPSRMTKDQKDRLRSMGYLESQ